MNTSQKTLTKIIFDYDLKYRSCAQEDGRKAVRSAEEDGFESRLTCSDNGSPVSGTAIFGKEASDVLQAQGTVSDLRVLHGETADPLYVTDSTAYAVRLQQEGCAVCGWRHAGNEQETFDGIRYCVMEPDQLEADSYQKIWQRIRHLPWTILQTKRMIVRELTVADLPGLYRLYDEEALRYLAPLSDNYDEEESFLATYIEKVYGFYGYGSWALIEKTTGELIGRAGFVPPARRGEPDEIGYLIRADRRSAGYGSEAVRAILEYGRQYLGMESVLALIRPDNEPSIRLVKKLGFAADGMQRSEGRTCIRYIRHLQQNRRG